MAPAAFTAPLPLTRPLSHIPSATTPRRPPRSALASPPPPLRPPSNDSTPDHPPPSPISLHGKDSLEDILLRTPPQTLVVVVFHARWCRVCKTLLNKLPRVSMQYPGIVWTKCDFAEMENKPLCSQLGVKLLPTVRFYRGGMAVMDQPLGQFTTGPFGAKRLEERLREVLDSGVVGF